MVEREQESCPGGLIIDFAQAGEEAIERLDLDDCHNCMIDENTDYVFVGSDRSNRVRFEAALSFSGERLTPQPLVPISAEFDSHLLQPTIIHSHYLAAREDGKLSYRYWLEIENGHQILIARKVVFKPEHVPSDVAEMLERLTQITRSVTWDTGAQALSLVS